MKFRHLCHFEYLRGEAEVHGEVQNTNELEKNGLKYEIWVMLGTHLIKTIVGYLF